ncbi:MAG: hypothetical protein KDK25_05550 [Leptospiraceae bacterium]|nr:hypothetical protein [Leptospiraceae bacterium]
MMRFRLVHHFGDGFDHGDLFLDIGEEELPTFEMSAAGLHKLVAWIGSMDSGCPPGIGLGTLPGASADFAETVHRKKNHRRKYMQYSGPISHGRGEVQTALEGELNFSFPGEQWPEKLWFWVQACEDSPNNHKKGNIP